MTNDEALIIDLGDRVGSSMLEMETVEEDELGNETVLSREFIGGCDECLRELLSGRKTCLNCGTNL